MGGYYIYRLYNNNYSAAHLLATSTTVNFNDLLYTIAVTSDVTTVQETTSGVTDSVTFTFTTTGVPDGTVLRCYLEAVGSGSLFKARDVYEAGTTSHQYGDDSSSIGYR